MILFTAITFFIERLSALKSYRRGVYASVEDEVKAAFSNVGIEQIRQNNDMILIDENHIVIKLRLPDRKHKLSKKDGFRLIYLVYKDREEVAFLDVYPKNGPLQQLDITDVHLVALIQQYIEEKQQGTLNQF